MDTPRIHLIAPAASCRPFFPAIGVTSAAELIGLVRGIIGSDYVVTGDEGLIEAPEDESAGGRRDDRARAEDIERALEDSRVVAVMALRGGAWFTRILPMIDFSVLDVRTRPIVVFGFSELTTLVNIVGGRGYGLGVYDMAPAFLTYGLRRHVSMPPGSNELAGKPREQWVTDRLKPEFRAFFEDAVAMIEGRGSCRPVTAELVRGSLSEESDAIFVGGNLTVLSTLVGSAYRSYVEPDSRWLLIEDFNDKIERIDRFLAHLTLAGWWERCAGILLGDFHRGYIDQSAAVVALLEYHLGVQRTLPILKTSQIGHVWPMSPLPIHQRLTIVRNGESSFSIRWPASLLTAL